MKAILLAGLLLAGYVPGLCLAEEFSSDQQAVWNAAKGMLNNWINGDIDATYEAVHPRFVWWNGTSELPGDRATAYLHDKAGAKHLGKWLSFDVTPLTVLVEGDTAIVNAYMRGLKEPAKGGTPVWTTSRFHSTWSRLEGRWKQIANYRQDDP